ncbi:hypothetical protein SAMN04488242_0309 [Tessaracoccus oleiagri]|uniref:YHS domain-containing protein n=2 Tax=Tessaracoccus oleiagri TaxID=686624 RepID=A0A1G9HH76_9ACTN|nr:hypothetical protein SAMN04488242_0309 [Tessaracoccus oleiagri]
MMNHHGTGEGCCGKHGGTGAHGHASGHGHHGTVIAGPGDEVVICAVRGNQTLRSTAEDAGLFRDRAGQRYFFCCAHCAELFDADPTAHRTAGSYGIH